MKKLTTLAVLAISLQWWSALSTTHADEMIFSPKRAINMRELDSLRGGFFTDGRLKISLGIERSVLINNELVATTILNIPDLAALAGRGAAGVQLQGSPATLIQNGAANNLGESVLQSFGPGLLTIIQNSLDNQLIQGHTVINTHISGVGSLGMSETISALNVQTRSAAR